MNTSQYAFADRAHEQRRLASQAKLFDPLTERSFERRASEMECGCWIWALALVMLPCSPRGLLGETERSLVWNATRKRWRQPQRVLLRPGCPTFASYKAMCRPSTASLTGSTLLSGGSF